MFIFRPVARSAMVPLGSPAVFVLNNPSTWKYDGSTVSTISTSVSTFGNQSATATVVNETTYEFGGSLNAFPGAGGAANNTIRKFTGQVASATGISLYGGSGYGASTSTTNSGVALIFGGTDGFAFYYNNINTFNEVASGTRAQTLAAGVYYASSTTVGTTSFIFGGHNGSSQTNSIQRYDNSTRSTDGATLAANLIAPGVCNISSTMFIFGGYSGSVGTSTIQRYDGTTRSTDGSTLSAAVATPPASTLGSNAFIFVSNNINRYNGTTRTTDSATLSSDAFGLQAVTFSGAGPGFL